MLAPFAGIAMDGGKKEPSWFVSTCSRSICSVALVLINEHLIRFGETSEVSKPF